MVAEPRRHPVTTRLLTVAAAVLLLEQAIVPPVRAFRSRRVASPVS